MKMSNMTVKWAIGLALFIVLLVFLFGPEQTATWMNDNFFPVVTPK